MFLVKAIAILFFVISLGLGVLAADGYYRAHAEQTNKDIGRASHIITESGSYEYQYTVDYELVAMLRAGAWKSTLYCVVTLALGGILWGLAVIGDKISKPKP